MSDQPRDFWIDELERDLGQPAVLRLLANAGGQRRHVPKRAKGSRLTGEVGLEVVKWLVGRFAGTELDIPSLHARQGRDRPAELRAAVLDAGLTDPKVSANVLATEFGVTAAWVHKLRVQMRREEGIDNQLALPLFDDHLSS